MKILGLDSSGLVASVAEPAKGLLVNNQPTLEEVTKENKKK